MSEGREVGEVVEEVGFRDSRFHSSEGDSKVGEVGSRRGGCREEKRLISVGEEKGKVGVRRSDEIQSFECRRRDREVGARTEARDGAVEDDAFELGE